MRDVAAYAKRGQFYLENSHFDLGEFLPLLDMANEVSVIDALFAAYFAGVALGYEEAMDAKTAEARAAGVPF